MATSPKTVESMARSVAEAVTETGFETMPDTTTETIDPPLTDLRRHGSARTCPQLSHQLIAMS